jgi:hypothetical protein
MKKKEERMHAEKGKVEKSLYNGTASSQLGE